MPRAALCLALVVAACIAGGCGAGTTAPGSPKPLVIKSLPPKRLHVTRQAVGPPDAHDFDLALLVPRGARLRQLWYLHGRRAGSQALVEWIRSPRVSLYAGDFATGVRWGLTLWTQAPRRSPDFQSQWQGVALPLVRYPPGAPDLRVDFADVTGDGQPDVLLEQYPGTNHGCGPHTVIATLAHRQVWRLFRSSLCETTLHGDHGLLALDLPYYVGDSLCCPSKVERRRLRWTGRRYVTASDRIVPARR